MRMKIIFKYFSPKALLRGVRFLGFNLVPEIVASFDFLIKDQYLSMTGFDLLIHIKHSRVFRHRRQRFHYALKRAV
jgi:hypothetical protein